MNLTECGQITFAGGIKRLPDILVVSRTEPHQLRTWLNHWIPLVISAEAHGLSCRLANGFERLAETVEAFTATPPAPPDPIVANCFEAGDKVELIAPSKSARASGRSTSPCTSRRASRSADSPFRGPAASRARPQGRNGPVRPDVTAAKFGIGHETQRIADLRRESKCEISHGQSAKKHKPLVIATDSK